MKLGMEADLGPGHIVFDEHPLALPKSGAALQYSAHVSDSCLMLDYMCAL